ncbi:50S ribosomal protein L24 [Candidatus Woesearchaeota archaeon]|nr:50S ribosomal protein L24 [Candidatus Woesearchaeota archaeon]
MKKISLHWKSSRNPRKQRKYVKNAPLHLRKKFISCNLSEEIRKLYKKKNVPVIKGDKVKIMRGQFKKIAGVVNKVDMHNIRVYVEGAEIVRKDGTKRFYPIHPSNLQIIELKTDDKKRRAMLERNVKK